MTTALISPMALFRVEAEANSTLNVGSDPESDAINTIIYIFQQTENGIEYIDFIDQGWGNPINFVAETGTYYLGLLGYDDSQQGLCQIEINSTARNRR